MDTVVVSRLLLSKKEDEANAAQHLLTEAAARSKDERDAAVRVLMAALDRDEQSVRRRANVAAWITPCLAFAATIGTLMSLRDDGHIFFAPFWIFLAGVGSNVGTALARRANRCSKLRMHIALALASHDNTRALGPLIEAFAAAGEDSERRAVTHALTGLLPFVAYGHESLLNDRQRDALNTALGRWNPNKAGTTDEEINGFVALVEVAARVGGKSAVAALTSLLAKGAKADDEWCLIRAAQAGLATLNERLERSNQVTANAPRFRTRP